MKRDLKAAYALIGLAVLLVVGMLVWTLVINNRAAETPQPSAMPKDEGAEVNMVQVTAPTEEEIAAAKSAGTIPVTVETAQGTIELELRGDLMPLTVANFVKLAKAGFYDGLVFHRVEDWVIQGGDPQGTGYGGPGYAIKLETHKDLPNVRGAVAMARSANPDSAGSQFYILRTDAPHLDGAYAVFGNVVSGMDVVDKIKSRDAIKKVTVGE
ncbi:MAG: peptidylprolyl isomerase [Limnochordia bacterium]|jgi:peptidyl-prolyl cis-trans isomerase B (cyclophilin B)